MKASRFSRYRNSRFVAVMMGVAIFLMELGVMLFLEALPDRVKDLLPGVFWAFIDPVILSILVSPLLYAMLFKPMRARQAELMRTQQQLSELNANLEQHVQERTHKLLLTQNELERDIALRSELEAELRANNQVLEKMNRQLLDTQNRLLQSDKILNEAQRLAHVGSWERELVANSFTCSEEILRILEIDSACRDISFETFILAIHPEDRETVEQAYMTCFQTREPFNITHRLQLFDGRVKWVSQNGTFHYDANGVPLRSIGTIQDVTERKLADDRLRIAACAFETHDGIMITDAQCRIISVNRAFRAITGYGPEEVLGKNPRILGSGRQDKVFYAEMWQQLLNNGSWSGEIWNKRKNGQIYPERLTITAVKNELDETSEYVGIFNDITERKQAEDMLRIYNEELIAINGQLRDAQDMLLQSEKMSSIGQLAAGVAHEINNPIGYVYSNLGTLEKYVQDVFSMLDSYEQTEGAITDEAMRKRLQEARKKLDIDFLKEDLHALMEESKDGITRVKKIVQNLKDFSHVDAADEWHFADLHKGLDSTLNIVNNEIKYKASVVKEYGNLPEVECLSSQLNQVFMNLLVNAAHAIEERGTITLRTGSQGDEVWVEVADTGKGIPAENLKKIFDPFFTTKPVGKGTGLGLSLSYGIIQKHHGRIEVQSEMGKGTTFRVWLPVRQVQDDTAQVSAHSVTPESLQTPSGLPLEGLSPSTDNGG